MKNCTSEASEAVVDGFMRAAWDRGEVVGRLISRHDDILRQLEIMSLPEAVERPVSAMFFCMAGYTPEAATAALRSIGSHPTPPDGAREACIAALRFRLENIHEQLTYLESEYEIKH